MLTDSNGNVYRIDLLEPATKVQLEQLHRKVGPRPLPSEFLDVLELTSGFKFVPMGELDFLGRNMSVETFFRSLPILQDGVGNFWVIDMEAGSDVLGPIIFWCHDPPVAVIQAPTLTVFLEQVFGLRRRTHKNMLEFTKDRCHQIWRHDHRCPMSWRVVHKMRNSPHSPDRCRMPSTWLIFVTQTSEPVSAGANQVPIEKGWTGPDSWS